MATNFRIVPTLPAVDVERAKKFYREKLGCTVERESPEPGALLNCRGDYLYVYKTAPSKAEHTLAGIWVDDIESEMRDLRGKGVKFEEYDIPSMGLKTVNGVATMGNMKGAWFKDSEGNIIGLTQEIKAGGSKTHEMHEKTPASR